MSEAKDEGMGSYLHPASGGLILGADWLFFSGVMFSGGFGLPFAMLFGFLTGLVGVTAIQRRMAGESLGRAAMKGLLSGVVIGLPFPVGGTLVGGAVLASSGLHHWRRRAAKELVQRARGRKKE